MNVTGLTEAKYQLDSKHLVSGGEGSIYHVIKGRNNKLAKIYHPDIITPDLEEKIKFIQ